MRMMALVAALACAPAFAQDVTQDDAREQTARTARSLMQARQNGVEAERLMAPVKNIPVEAIRERAREIVQRALETPLYQTPKAQERAISEFANREYAACMCG